MPEPTVHRNVVISFEDAPNVQGTMTHSYTGLASVVTLGAESKGRSCDIVVTDPMTCVMLKAGNIKFL